MWTATQTVPTVPVQAVPTVPVQTVQNVPVQTMTVPTVPVSNLGWEPTATKVPTVPVQTVLTVPVQTRPVPTVPVQTTPTMITMTSRSSRHESSVRWIAGWREVEGNIRALKLRDRH